MCNDLFSQCTTGYEIWDNLNFPMLRIPDIHDFISEMVLVHAKNKAVSLKDANTATSTKLKDKVDRSPMNTLMSIPQKC